MFGLKVSRILLFAACLLASWPSGAFARNKIFSLEKKTTEFSRDIRGKPDRITGKQVHYFIRFEAGENFLFVIPQKYIKPQRIRFRFDFFDQGSTIYWYHEDEDDPGGSYTISNRLLKYRQGLLAAEKYFKNAIQKAGLELRWWKPDKPITVVVGRTRLRSSFAETNFIRQRMVMKAHWEDFDTRLIAAHEYFHLIQGAVSYYGDKRNYIRKRLIQSKDPFKSFLDEMTAEWATDEPINVKKLKGPGAKNLDELNEYLLKRSGPRFFVNNKAAFFTKDRYDSNILIKYFAEQMAGKSDRSGAEHVLKLIRKMYDMGGVNKETFFKAFASMLPDRDFASKNWPEKWELKWSKFFTAFCASNVVQNSLCKIKPGDPLGYHDDAFTSLTWWYRNSIENHWINEASRHSKKVYSEPARTDIERRNRLETLLGPDERVEALAYKLHHVKLFGLSSRFEKLRSKAAPRPIFIFAKGMPGTDVFLMRQKYRKGTYYQRKSSKFEWMPAFTFSDEWATVSARILDVIKDYNTEEEKQDLWVGLVNSGTDLRPRTIAWSYQASPRLIPWPYKVTSAKSSKTVDLVSGSAYLRHVFSDYKGFFNGDTFEIGIRSEGPLHRDGADLDDLKLEDIAAEVKILDEFDNEISLKERNGKYLKIHCTPYRGGHIFPYWFSGQIDEKNRYTGKCRFYVKITSPLNLGGEDQQIDETFTFELRPIHPTLKRLVVSAQGENRSREVIYDSSKSSRRIPKPQGDAYRLYVEATFSIPMKEKDTHITAGKAAPHNQYKVQELKFRGDGRVCSGSITIPKSDVPRAGMLLRFAVSGISKKMGELDADLLTTGAQPDTSHFILLGIEEYYDLALSSDTVQRAESSNYSTYGKLGPVGILVRLMPHIYDDGSNNLEVQHFQGLLAITTMRIKEYNRLLRKQEIDYERFKSNPEKGVEDTLREKKKQLKIMEVVLKNKKELFGKQPQKKESFFNRMEKLKKAIKETEGSKSLAQKLLEEKKEDLRIQKQKLAFLEKRYLPLVEAATRVMNGFKKFYYKRELSGPISIFFQGMRANWHPPKGPQSVRYEDYHGRPGKFRIRQGRVQAEGWAYHDIRDLPGEIKHWGGPYLLVWDFWPSDIEKVRMLANLSGHYPAYLPQKSKVKLPDLGLWMDQTDIMKRMFDVWTSDFKFRTDSVLLGLSKLMWEFFPKDERPDFDNPRHEDGTVKKAALTLPVLKTDRLIKLSGHYIKGVGVDIPIKAKGYDDELFYHSQDGARLALPPDEREVTEESGLHMVRTEKHYEEGYVRRTEARWNATFDWIGVTEPPALLGPHMTVGGMLEDRFLAVRDYYELYFTSYGGVLWSMSDTNCLQDFDTSPNTHFYAQPQGNLVYGSFNGLHRSRTNSGLDMDFRWKTHWRLERVGQKKQVDPKEDLPTWEEDEGKEREKMATPPLKPTKVAKPKRGLASASSYDPKTGITTESHKNPDRSRTITQTDKNGKVISKRTEPPPDKQLPSASAYERNTGITTSAQRNPDGSTTITQKDQNGKVITKRVLVR